VDESIIRLPVKPNAKGIISRNAPPNLGVLANFTAQELVAAEREMWLSCKEDVELILGQIDIANLLIRMRTVIGVHGCEMSQVEERAAIFAHLIIALDRVETCDEVDQNMLHLVEEAQKLAAELGH
jgi:hypothetical protein